MGSNARGILKCLHARTGKKQQLRDVHNIIQSQKREMRGSKTSAERSVSAYAYELVAAEHRYAASVDADYDVINTGDANAQIVSREIRRKSLVSLQRFSCDCAFQQTMLLPCRHVFFARRFNRNETVIPPFSFYSQRWALRCPANDISQGEVTAGNAFREAKLTIEWVERAAWKEKYICPPFQDLRWIPKDIILVSTKKKIAGGYGGFNTSNSVVVGVVNFDGNHWVGFFGDREEKKAKMFDPLQRLTYEKITWCEQQGGNSCGVWCLVILELLLTKNK
ncbi:hypothetical protein PC123_g25344 [Phytophthora cactorum]|nr:hypothetical protein PC123_g25344 [Phytophthora cactorum]